MAYSFADRALSQRLERAEAESGAAFVDARARIDPTVGAVWREVAGAYALFDGPLSPVTQTFGLGLFEPAREGDLDVLESFFAERGAGVAHEVSPMADPALLALLPARGYRPVELTTLLHRPLDRDARTATTDVRVRVIEPGDAARWADIAAAGWGEQPALGDFMRGFGLVSANARGAVAFVAELGGEPIATAMLALRDDVAVLAGASTLPAFRNRGAQNALLAARLAYAADRGCEIATMGASPGSTSQVNAERNGFRVAYTRIKWSR